MISQGPHFEAPPNQTHQDRYRIKDIHWPLVRKQIAIGVVYPAWAWRDVREFYPMRNLSLETKVVRP